ncbi:MAG: hypothetical protein JNK12_25440 [Acidimicrobiales bacterium]|nr:hypothetical protein [Acidimicrobiales bacterium]
MSRWLDDADADASAALRAMSSLAMAVHCAESDGHLTIASGHPVHPYLEAYREAAAAVEWIDLADEWDRHPAAEVLRHALDLAAERSTFTPLDVVAEGLGIELPAAD